MKNYFSLMFVVVMLLYANGVDAQCDEGSKTNSFKVGEVEKLASGFRFTEGPAVDENGNIYFTDIPNHLILIWTIENELDTFRIKSGRANGLFFDKDENLLVCEGEKGRITATSSEGDYKSIVSEYNGVRFNQTNDLWPDSKGGVYFTDPKYGGGSKDITQDGMHVYYILPDRSSVIRVCDDLEKPNGVMGSPDGKVLYVADEPAKKVYKYDIKMDGSLINKTLFVEMGCDGMTVDMNGNVYLTPRDKKSVDIYSSSAIFIETIEVPEQPTNVCFGGKKRTQLYITARTSIYRVEMNTKGVD